MYATSELAEALEAYRDGKIDIGFDSCSELNKRYMLQRNPNSIEGLEYEYHIRGTVAEELADAVIRICAIAGIYGIDLDWHIAAKKAYGKTREYKHGRMA
jgi:NTP pyrophosphatase (non-canonical NTP hydrolase)